MNYIEDIQKSCSIKEGTGVIERFFQELYFNAPLSSKELSQRIMLPIPMVTALKKEGIRLGTWEQCGGGIKLTLAGKSYSEQVLGYENIDIGLYRKLMTSEEARVTYANILCKKYGVAFDERPSADVTLDQAQCTIRTAFRRALLCLTHVVLVGKHILCLGDDDFVSLAIGFLLKELYPTQNVYPTNIHVIDVDRRYIDFLQKQAKLYALPIKCEQGDLRMPLPTHLLGRFDCLFTDPPYTQEGASLFLSRAISTLKEEQGLKIFFSFGNKSIDEGYLLQKSFQLHGLSIKDILVQFNEYEGASSLGNKGQLFVLETTNRTRAVFPVEKKGRNDIYTRDRHPKQNSYRCKQCGQTYLVGSDKDFQTIKDLKEHGCLMCKCHIFQRQHKKKNPIVSKYHSLGHHILADFYDCSNELLDDVVQVRIYMHEAAIKAGATIVQENFHKFAPMGVSGVIVIQESHLTIHTWPECRYAAVDLFTCGTNVNAWAAFDYLQEKLGSGNVEYSDLVRGSKNS